MKGVSPLRPLVPCSTPGCDQLMTGLSVFGCRRCQFREHKRRVRAKAKGKSVPFVVMTRRRKFPLVPCSTPGCGRRMTGASPHGCRWCQQAAFGRKANAQRVDGKCYYCRKPAARKCCERCAAKRRRQGKLRRRQRAAIGLCERCPNMAETGRSTCWRCSDKISARNKKAYQKRKAITGRTSDERNGQAGKPEHHAVGRSGGVDRAGHRVGPGVEQTRAGEVDH
jgi:hypothetical protein